MKVALQFAMPSELHALPGLKDRQPSAVISGIPIYELAPDLLAACGSLPDGADAGFYAAAVRLAREKGAQSIVDTSGEALRLSLDAAPTLLRCNRAEASAFSDAADACEAAREAAARGAA